MTKQNTAFVLKLLANILVLRLIFCDRSSRRGQLRQGRWAGRCEGDSGAGREHPHKGWWQWPQTAMSRGKSIGVRMGPGRFRRASWWVRISEVHGWARTYIWHSSGNRQGHELELSCGSCRRCGGPDQDSHCSFSHRSDPRLCSRTISHMALNTGNQISGAGRGKMLADQAQ